MTNRKLTLTMRLAIAFCLSCALVFTPIINAQNQSSVSSNAPDLKDLDAPASEMKSLIERYVADRNALGRLFPVEASPARQTRYKQFYSDWLATIGKLNFDAMSQDGKVDYLLFKTHLDHEAQQLEIQTKSLAEIAAMMPFSRTITDLAEARRRMEKIEPFKIATTLNELNKQIETTRRSVETGLRTEPGKFKRASLNRAVSTIGSLRNTLRIWFGYYNGYDPMFTWWNDEPYKAVDQTLGNYVTFLTERVTGQRQAAPTMAAAVAPGGGRVGGAGGGPGGGGGQRGGFGGGGGAANARPGDASDIIGDPIGREALMVELQSEMIPYTPEELIAIGWKELAWCEEEMKKASRELGFGDDWHKALEHVKNKYVEPGKQPEMIKALALEATEYVEKNNLVTVPPLEKG